LSHNAPDFGPIRTALFVPGNRPDRVDKAVDAGADAVIIDLEDAVPPTRKAETRPVVRDKVCEHKGRRIMVRVNGPDSDFIHGDIEAVVVEGLAGLMVPKVESPEDLEQVHRLLLAAEEKNGLPPGGLALLPLIESARGVQNVFGIVSARLQPERPVMVSFGAADYTLDLGAEMTRTGEELIYPRSRIAVACRAARVAPPLDTPFMIDLKDSAALETEARRAKQLGFQGKLCIHPSQVPVCNRVFSPTQEEIDFARRVVRAFEEAEAAGTASIQLEGRFIDYPIVERAARVLRLADLIEKA